MVCAPNAHMTGLPAERAARIARHDLRQEMPPPPAGARGARKRGQPRRGKLHLVLPLRQRLQPQLPAVQEREAHVGTPRRPAEALPLGEVGDDDVRPGADEACALAHVPAEPPQLVAGHPDSPAPAPAGLAHLHGAVAECHHRVPRPAAPISVRIFSSTTFFASTVTSPTAPWIRPSKSAA